MRLAMPFDGSVPERFHVSGPFEQPFHLASGAAASRFKRAFDIVAATTGLLFLAPLFIVVALMIRLESDGPVFFRQRRGGIHGRAFRIFKFRTMKVLEDGE